MADNKQSGDVLCYLTPEAALVVETMMSGGLSREAALSTIEAAWPEDAVYSVPPAKEDIYA